MFYNLRKRLTHELSLIRLRNTRLLYDYISLLLLQASNYFIPFLGFRYIVKIIGIEKFGYLQLANSFVTYFILIINYSFDFTATRKIAVNKNNPLLLEEVFREVTYAKFILLLVSSVLFLVTCVSYPLFRDNFMPFFSTYLITFGYFFFPAWFYQGMGQMRLAAIYNFFIKAISILVIVLIIRKSSDYIWFNFIFSLSQLLIGVVAFLYPVRKFGFRLPPFNLAKSIAWIKSGTNIFLSGLISQVYTTTNIFLMGVLLQDKAEVGYFSMGSKLFGVLQFLLMMPFNQLVFPLIARKFHESARTGHHVLKRILLAYSTAGLAISFAIYMFAPLLIKLVYGQPYPEAVQLFRLMAFLPFVISFSNIFGIQGLLNINGDKYFRRVILTGAILSVSLNILLIPRFKGLGAVWIWYATEILISLSLFIIYSRKVKTLYAR